MSFTLVVEDGPLKGRHFQLTDTRVTIGRQADCSIILEDPSVSRYHCELYLQPDSLSLRDLGSKNGTAVNGSRVDQTQLSPGDLVSVGVFSLRLSGETGGPELDALAPEDSTLTVSIAGPHQDASNRFSESIEVLVKEFQLGQRLLALYEISRVAQRAHSMELLFRPVAEQSLQQLAAQRMAVLLQDDPEQQPRWTAVYGQSGPVSGQAELDIARNVAVQVMAEGRAICCHPEQTVTSAPGQSRAGRSSIGSALCAPLASPEGTQGVLYVHRKANGAPFDEQDLQFFAAIANTVGLVLRNLRTRLSLQRSNERLLGALREQHQLVGQTPAFERVLDFVARAVESDATVLIRGETGTGKELVARAIHLQSPRAGGNFVPLNCAAVTETLVESQLFGSVKGAFTGADHERAGLLRHADGGTLFLDEIGEMALSTQAKLLRALEERKSRAVGSDEEYAFDIRLITATNRDLFEEVRGNRFRQDLYYRLHVLEVELPPLRERVADIPVLAMHFLQQFGKRAKRPIQGFSDDGLELLRRHPWPGNVRQLRNALERAVALGHGELITADDLAPALGNSDEFQTEQPILPLAEIERQHIVRALSFTGWQRKRAAQLLGIDRTTLNRKIKQYELHQ